jgi:hypothetical protein
MKKSNKNLVLSLAAAMVLSPVAVSAVSAIPTDSAIESPVLENDEIRMSEYVEITGKIEEITNADGTLSILVKNNNEEGLDSIIAYVDDSVILLSKEKKDYIDIKDLEVGMEVSVFYHKDTVMTKSLPPMLWPDVVVIDDAEENMSVMVSKFDKELLNAEKDMYIRISEDTIIVDKDGNKVDKSDLTDKDLIVFYDIVLLSYPGQTSPKKIIVLPDRENAAIDDTVEVKEISLKDELIKNDEGVTMIPLRAVAESLGYEVLWNQEKNTVELVKESQHTAVVIGENENGNTPVLVDSKTYVPLSFAEEILKVNVELLEDGNVKIFE